MREHHLFREGTLSCPAYFYISLTNDAYYTFPRSIDIENAKNKIKKDNYQSFNKKLSTSK